MLILIIGLAGMLLILFSDTDSNDKINEAALNNENTIYIADSVNEYGDFILHENRQPTYKRSVKDA